MALKYIKSTIDGAAYAMLIVIVNLGLLNALSMDGHLPHAVFRIRSITVFEIWTDGSGNRWTLGFPGLLLVAAVGGLLYGTGAVLLSRQEVRTKIKNVLFGASTR